MDEEIVMWGRPTCLGCIATRRMFDEAGLEYTYRDVDTEMTDAKLAELRALSGDRLTLPIVQTSHHGTWMEFEKGLIERLLADHGLATRSMLRAQQRAERQASIPPEPSTTAPQL